MYKSVFVLLALLIVSVGGQTRAATIFESATLGPTGIPITELTNQNVPGTNINQSVFAGVRFQIDQPVTTSQVGGHFVAGASGTFFGAIVALNDENDFPDSGDFSTPDFLGSTLLTFPVPSEEVFGDLSLSLNPGWYALVFGSELFGADGGGVAVRNNNDIGTPSYIAYQPTAIGWRNTDATMNYRFSVIGSIVPEPSTLVFATAAFLLLLQQRKLKNRF